MLLEDDSAGELVLEGERVGEPVLDERGELEERAGIPTISIPGILPEESMKLV